MSSRFFPFFKKTLKNYAHKFSYFFKKQKSLWSRCSHHAFFGKSPKDFSFLDIYWKNINVQKQESHKVLETSQKWFWKNKRVMKALTKCGLIHYKCIKNALLTLQIFHRIGFIVSEKYFKKAHGHLLEIAFWTFIGHLLDIF